ncbi:hypothetical protein [Gemmatimonas sp.]|nr:hypothetical protein [Gemmatimonas sp.]
MSSAEAEKGRRVVDPDTANSLTRAAWTRSLTAHADYVAIFGNLP